MPWPSKHVPKYREHRCSRQAVVTLNGVDHYLGPHGSVVSQREYDRLIHEWLAAGRRLATEANVESITVSVVIANYWRFAQGYYIKNGKPTSEVAAIKNAVRPLRELYGTLAATEFGPLALKAVRLKYVENGLSRQTVNQNVGRVIRMFRWAAEHEQVPASVPQAQPESLQEGRRHQRLPSRRRRPSDL